MNRGYTTVPIMIALLVIAIVGLYYVWQVHIGAYTPTESVASNQQDIILAEKMKGNADVMSPQDVVAQYGTLPSSPLPPYPPMPTPLPPLPPTSQSTQIDNGSFTGELSVPGMSKYVDDDFNFSFWYPTGWTVQKQSDERYGENTGHLLTILSPDESSGIHLLELTPTNGRAVTGVAKYETGIYFDANTHQWMEFNQGNIDIGAHETHWPADVSDNTMGGLHIILGIVPLSAHDFVQQDPDRDWKGEINATPLLRTILASDPDVATPASRSVQLATIKAEADALDVNASDVDQNEDTSEDTSTDAVTAVSFSATPSKAVEPATINFTLSLGAEAVVAGYYTIDFGDGESGDMVSACAEDGYAGCSSSWSLQHTYDNAGYYTAKLTRIDESGSTSVASTQIIVTRKAVQ